VYGSLTAEERSAVTNGWIMRARVRVVETHSVTNTSALYSFESTLPSFLKNHTMVFGTDNDGNAVLGLYDGTLTWGPPFEWGFEHVYSVGSGGYHLYELRYDPELDKAELYVDGVDTGIDYAGYANASGFNRILWGSNASVLTGNVNYNLVEFEILSTAVLGTVFLLR
jgi:hypothetical protein